VEGTGRLPDFPLGAVRFDCVMSEGWRGTLIRSGRRRPSGLDSEPAVGEKTIKRNVPPEQPIELSIPTEPSRGHV